MISLSSLFISNAYADAAGAAAEQPNTFMQFLPLLTLLVIFYFLVLRPQQKRAKDQKSMMEALQKGDEIVTNGGILGRITKAGDSNLSVEIADGVVITIQRSAVQSVLPKGSLKSAN